MIKDFNNDITKIVIKETYAITNIRKVFAFYKHKTNILTFQIIILFNNKHKRLKIDMNYDLFRKKYLKIKLSRFT